MWVKQQPSKSDGLKLPASIINIGIKSAEKSGKTAQSQFR
ncbi:hypothetical protein GPUN_0822 [Glaciecola punicea ACAM 611]|uniref:Uncharacterized protein n=1 Tax=Glaciecola punicea ACAM 611 TaxID=1121923 RepID=H5T9I0_9ALTE|nr:hypothetical protein GPUN_0822 [Glaciecola punicea ACAM 611]